MSGLDVARKVVEDFFNAADALVTVADGEVVDALDVLNAVVPTHGQQGRLLYALVMLEAYRRQDPAWGLQVHDLEGGEDDPDRRCQWCGRAFRRDEDHNLMWTEGTDDLRYCCDACYPVAWGGGE